jgi:hypothetical protein
MTPSASQVSTVRVRWAGVVLLLAACALLAAFSVWRYYQVVQPMLGDWNAWHRTTMKGEMGAPLRYRLISFLLPELVVRITGVEPWVAYLWERFAFLFATAALWWGFCRRWLTGAESALALLAFFALYDLSIYPHFQPSEEINIFAFLLGFIAIADRRFAALAAVIAIGSFNKDTVVFLIPVYSAFELLRARRIDTALVCRSAVLCALFFAIRHGIRVAVGERPYFTDFWQYAENLRALAQLDHRYYYFLLPSLVPAALILRSWTRQPLLMRATALATPLFVAAHFAISIVLEFRTHMPLALVMIPAAILFARDRVESPALGPGCARTREW